MNYSVTWWTMSILWSKNGIQGFVSKSLTSMPGLFFSLPGSKPSILISSYTLTSSFLLFHPFLSLFFSLLLSAPFLPFFPSFHSFHFFLLFLFLFSPFFLPGKSERFNYLPGSAATTQPHFLSSILCYTVMVVRIDCLYKIYGHCVHTSIFLAGLNYVAKCCPGLLKYISKGQYCKTKVTVLFKGNSLTASRAEYTPSKQLTIHPLRLNGS